MRGHAQSTIKERTRSQEELRQELQGRNPKGPFEFAADLSFSDLEPSEDDAPAVARFKRAVMRDSRHSTACATYLRIFGLSQGIRSIYDGGRQLIEGGAE